MTRALQRNQTRRRPRPAPLILVLALALGACASAERTAVSAGGAPLSGAAVAALVGDRTLAVVEAFSGAAMSLYFAPDGALERLRPPGPAGRWWVDAEGRLCALEPGLADGPTCRRVVARDGLHQMFGADGALALTVARIEPGRVLAP